MQQALRSQQRDKNGRFLPFFKAITKPPKEEPIDSLLSRRTAEWKEQEKREEYEKLIQVESPFRGPYGIMVFGDLHLDDPGCNIELLMKHIKIAQSSPYVLAIQVGDIQNSWVGKLSHLWKDQRTTGHEAFRLAQWFFDQLREKLFLVVRGNHDLWAMNVNGLDVVEWIKRGNDDLIAESHGARIQLLTKDNDITINARHDFPGGSTWNAAHGPARAAMLGWRDDILVCGHIHVSGYNMVIDPAGTKVSHAVRVASYKHRDVFAKALGVHQPPVFECPMFIVDPSEEDFRYKIMFVPSPAKGLEILTALRARRNRW